MLRFRETSPELQQSQQEDQGPPPNVMDAKGCQIQDYDNVAGANTHSTAPSSANDVRGTDTGRSANIGSCKDQPGEKLCNKNPENKDKDTRHKQLMESECQSET